MYPVYWASFRAAMQSVAGLMGARRPPADKSGQQLSHPHQGSTPRPLRRHDRANGEGRWHGSDARSATAHPLRRARRLKDERCRPRRCSAPGRDPGGGARILDRLTTRSSTSCRRSTARDARGGRTSLEAFRRGSDWLRACRPARHARDRWTSEGPRPADRAQRRRRHPRRPVHGG